MPKPKQPRSKEKPVIGEVDLQTMRYYLSQYVATGTQALSQESLDDCAPKVRDILADERLLGHYGYVTVRQMKNIDHPKLQQYASVLLSWVERWLR